MFFIVHSSSRLHFRLPFVFYATAIFTVAGLVFYYSYNNSVRNLPSLLRQLSLPPVPRASSNRIRHELLPPSSLRTESAIAQAATATITPLCLRASPRRPQFSMIPAMQTRADLANNALHPYFDTHLRSPRFTRELGVKLFFYAPECQIANKERISRLSI